MKSIKNFENLKVENLMFFKGGETNTGAGSAYTGNSYIDSEYCVNYVYITWTSDCANNGVITQKCGLGTKTLRECNEQ